jgi:chemotaxis protein CheX
MEARFINPFISSVSNTMQTMLGVRAEQLDPVVREGNVAHGDISGIVGIVSSVMNGSVALTFPAETALAIYKKMIGETVTEVNDDIRDTVGEFANIIAGGAKKELAEMDCSFEISIPTVVMGNNHTISHKGSTPAVVIPFKFDSHPFEMEISMKFNKPKQ